METEEKWSTEERKLQINILELLAVKIDILTFVKEKITNPVHIQSGNTTAFSYLLELGGTTDKIFIELSKDI